MNANWRSTRAPNVVFINTDLHRATLLDEDVAFPLDNPGAWMAKHTDKPQPPKLNKAAVAVWAVYWLIVAAAIFSVVMP